jgi:multidrug efflux system membrane fusion protein
MAKALLKQREIEYKASKSLSVKGFRAETSLAQAEAALEAARAELARIEVDIANTKVRAPFDGVLNTRPMELGDFVSVGDEVATVVDLDPIYVVGYVSEREVGHFKLGDAGTARLTDGRVLQGTIHYIAAMAESATRTFRVELEVPNPDGAVVDGVTAELEIEQGATRAHLVSPAILSLSDEGIVGIKAVGADNVVAFHPVQILGDGPEGVWLGGLEETLTVITVGHEFVQPGHAVIPVRLADGDAETTRGTGQAAAQGAAQ